METNNRLREAVQKLLDVLYDMGVDENTLAIAIESPNCHMKSEYTLSVLKEARAALAEPAKNCEVGTVEEQAKRLNEWCNGRHCINCRFKGGWPDECKLKWAQMPYEEGVQNAE